MCRPGNKTKNGQRFFPTVELVRINDEITVEAREIFHRGDETPHKARAWHLHCAKQQFSDRSVTWVFCTYALKDPEDKPASQLVMRFCPLHGKPRNAGYPDASYHNNEDKSSRGAHVSFLAEERDLRKIIELERLCDWL